MNSSPDKGSFQREGLLQRAEEGETSVEHAEEMIELFKTMDQRRAELEADEEWRQNNLEYDLRSTRWICDKAKASESYAQNIYAALCNQDWQKNDVWPLLKGQTYSCSWRYAGGIVADMIEKGDYIDWYCSGIGGPTGGGSEVSPEHEAAMLAMKDFVSEGTVTDEIREDFFRLGWIPVDADEE
jgi:hypothetical protein